MPFRGMSSSVSLPLLSFVIIFSFIYIVQQPDTLKEDSLGPILAASKKVRREDSRRLLERAERVPKFSKLVSNYSLTLEKHDRIRSSQSPQLFAYFSPWCGHCQHFIPAFISRADKYQIDPNISYSNISITPLSIDGEDPDILFGTINCSDERELCQREKIDAYPTVIARYFPLDKKSMVPHGVKLDVDPKNIRDYIRKFHPAPSQLASLFGGENLGNQKVNNNNIVDNSRDRDHENPELKKWLLMTRQGAARFSLPDERLRDALMSLNYMIVEESFQAFNEMDLVSEYDKISKRLIGSRPAKVRNKSIIERLLGDYTGDLKKTKTNNELEAKLDYIPLQNSIKIYVENINRLITGDTKFRWRTCGLLVADRQDEKNQEKNQNHHSSHMYKGLKMNGNHSGSEIVTQARVGTGTSKVTRETRRGGGTRTRTRTTGTRRGTGVNKGTGVVVDTGTGELKVSALPIRTAVPFAEAAEGYTCGLWLLLHFLTVASGQQQIPELKVIMPEITGSKIPSSKISDFKISDSNAFGSTVPTDNRITTGEMFKSIRSLVSELFGCVICRGHFLNAFDSCEHSRCSVQPSDFNALQYWLFEFHNSVTTNIYREKIRGKHSTLYSEDTVETEKIGKNGYTISSSKTGSAEKYPDNITYPPHPSCPTCLNPAQDLQNNGNDSKDSRPSLSANHIKKKYNRESVIEHLVASYWDSSWSIPISNATATATVTVDPTSISLLTKY